MLHLSKILPALIEDHPALTKLTIASKSYWGYSHDQVEQWRALLTITPDYILTNSVYKVLSKDTLAGYYSYQEKTNHTVELDNMFVAPVFIRKGIGSILIQDFLNKVMQKGFTKIVLKAEPFAEGFYTNYGFRKTGQLESSIPGRFLPVMEKEI